MKILLIDNHSKHKDELIRILGENATVETQEQLSDLDADIYDLIVISGGSNIPSLFYNPEAYAKEISLVQNTKTAILGICLGSEIITKAFGGTLKDLGYIHRGKILINITDDSLKNKLNSDSLEAYEAHEIGIKDMPSEFTICGYGEHGPEIIKHQSKPIIGVQFHPEVTPNANLIQWFMESLK